MKILVFALSGIGDALLFTPSLVKLREIYQDAQIDTLVMFKGAESIYRNLPFISNVYYYDFINSNPFSAFMYLMKFRKKYDLTINVYPSNRREYNLINFLTGAPKRAAIRYSHNDFINLGFLNNISIRENDSLHNVQENIRLVEKISGTSAGKIPPLQITLGEEEENFSEEYLSAHGITENDIVIGFHPGCATLKNHIKRRWEPEKFTALGKKLIGEKGAKIFVFGGPEEEILRNKITDDINSENVFSIKTNNLLQSISLMKRCNVFVTNDSALMHVASALQLNVVAIIGPTNVNYIRPWQTNHKIVSLNLECAPCFYYSPKPLTCERDDVEFKCIKELGVELVYAKVEEFLD